MLKSLISLLVIISLSLGCLGKEKLLVPVKSDNKTIVNKEDQKIKEKIKELIEIAKTNDKSKFASLMKFPIELSEFIPAINNKKDFIENFDYIFDSSLINLIANSSLDDWESIGWRGYALGNGKIYIDEDGITTINHKTSKLKGIIKKKLNSIKNNLPPALRNYKTIECRFATKTYLIQVNEMHDGTYQYIAWLNNAPSGKPSVVINNGEYITEGSGGNYCLKFKNNGLEYTILVTMTGTELTPPYRLIISKNSKEKLNEKGNNIKL
jgi:hypothetical protein